MVEYTIQKEEFEKIMVKSIQNREKYDCIAILPEGTRAWLCDSEISKVCRAVVLLERDEKVDEWEVDDYKIEKCPYPLQVCIKNLNALYGCAGNPDNEDSYFTFKKLKEAEIQDVKIFGAIEIAEYAVVFYYDCRLKQSYYVSQPKYGKESTDIFELVKQLRKMEGRVYGHKGCCKQGLEDATSPLRFPWEDNLW